MMFRRKSTQVRAPALIVRTAGCIQVIKTSMDVLLLDHALAGDSNFVTKMVDPNRRNRPRQASPHCFDGQYTNDMVAEAINN